MFAYGNDTLTLPLVWQLAQGKVKGELTSEVKGKGGGLPSKGGSHGPGNGCCLWHQYRIWATGVIVEFLPKRRANFKPTCC